MRIGKRSAAVAMAAAVTLAAGGLWVDRSADAADHLDPPMRTDPAVATVADTAADIADVFAFNDASTVTLIVTNAGPRAGGLPAVYDKNVLYRLHVSTDGDATTDENIIDVRYGQDPAGNWGVQFSGIPGTAAPISGPVQTTLTSGAGTRAIAGLFDDPFFFDLEGFKATQSTGTLSIKNTRNFFAGKNDTSFVIDFPRAAITPTNNTITVWAETRRISGS